MKFWVAYVIVIFRVAVVAVPFQDFSLDFMNKEIEKLSGTFAHVKSAEALLGVKKAKDAHSGYQCSPLIARVSHVDSLMTDVERPQVLLSGEIHGDERIGPVASLHTGYLMVTSASCAIEGNKDACSKLVKVNGLSKPQIVWLAYLATRRDTFIIPSANCLGYKSSVRADAGVDPNRDFAYSRDKGQADGHGEGNDLCLRSTTAKIFNKLMELTIFQLVITFHGGMQAIAYEWGSKNHPKPKDVSPDDHANKQLGEAFSYIGGYGFPGVSKPYPYGPMNSVVYGVDGGMEDWMYAAGWDRGNIPPGEETREDPLHHHNLRRHHHRRLFGVLHNCTVETNSRHPPNNRALVFLVETSDRKRPAANEWGDDANILGGRALDLEGHPDEESVALGPGASINGNGHVPRNVRLALASVDAVQPYVCINKVSKSIQNSDRSSSGSSSSSSSSSSISKGGKASGLKVEWSVGGSFAVDGTWLSWHPAEVSEEEMSSSTTFGLGAWQVLHTTDIDRVAASLEGRGKSNVKDKDEDVAAALKEVGLGPGSSVQSGSATWGSRSKRDAHPTAPAIDPFGAAYSAILTVPDAVKAGEYWVAAWAVVDKAWGDTGQGYPQSQGPQSWLSLARTNTTMHYTSHAHPHPPLDKQWPSPSKTQPRSVRGRVMWASAPLRVRVSDDGAVAVVAATYQCAWWARGPESVARNPVPPLAIKINPPDDVRLPGQPKPVPPSSIGDSDSNDNSHKTHIKMSNGPGKSMQNAVTLLLGFLALLLGSYLARKTLPIVVASLLAWRHRRGDAGSGSSGEANGHSHGHSHGHMRLAQSEDEADRERVLELELGMPGDSDHDYDSDD